MTKLYYTSTSCGAASFIAAFTAGINIETEQVDIGTHLTTTGADFYKINPKGNVPCLVLNDGVVLNENSAVLQYIADLVRNYSLLSSPDIKVIQSFLFPGSWSDCSLEWN